MGESGAFGRLGCVGRQRVEGFALVDVSFAPLLRSAPPLPPYPPLPMLCGKTDARYERERAFRLAGRFAALVSAGLAFGEIGRRALVGARTVGRGQAFGNFALRAVRKMFGVW